MAVADGGGGAPDFSIPGDPGALRGLADQLDDARSGFSGGAAEVRAVSVVSWSGSAAAAFGGTRSQVVSGWTAAAADMAEAASALRSYASALHSAQDAARRAKQRYDDAQAATQTAVTAHNDAVNRAASAPAGAVVVVPPFTDPGEAGRSAALTALTAARESVHTAGASAAATIRAAYFGAPMQPRVPAPTPPVLDLNDGSTGPGLTPGLPTDSASLKRLLDMARGSGLAPTSYADILRQYYVALAAEHAGIDLATWDPSLGVDGNRQTIENVYTYYGQLFLNHPQFQWAGMANMIGPSFAGAFFDLDALGDLADTLGGPIDELPPEVRHLLPPPLGQIGDLSSISAGDLRYYENTFLAMQKEIFVDQAGMHEAYLQGGTAAIDELAAARIIDPEAKTAWYQIDEGTRSGDQNSIMNGNMALLSREQNQIIPDEYDAMRHHLPSGEVFTYAMGAVGAPTIPGAHTAGEVSPLTLDARVPLNAGPFTVAHADVSVTTPLPDFNISDRQARWDMIVQDTLPRYQDFLAQHPAEARALIASDVGQRIDAQRLQHQIDDIAGRLTSGWRVDVDTGWGG